MQKLEKEIIATKLDTLIQLVAVALTENKKEQKEQIRLLVLAGLSPVRIAEILGTTGNSVNGAIAKMRKAKQLPEMRENAKN
jgi:DNA-directed RNA polymerase specialized sigma24 family protein